MPRNPKCFGLLQISLSSAREALQTVAFCFFLISVMSVEVDGRAPPLRLSLPPQRERLLPEESQPHFYILCFGFKFFSLADCPSLHKTPGSHFRLPLNPRKNAHL